MTIPSRLSQSFTRVLGDDAAADFLTWMHAVESSRSDLREMFELGHGRLDSRLSEFRHELRADIAELRQHTEAGIAQLRQEFAQLRQEFADLRTDLHAGLAQARQESSEIRRDVAALSERIGQVDARIDRRYADLVKWSFVFWITSTLTIAALILSRT